MTDPPTGHGWLQPLDQAYTNDTDKKLNINNASGLELESSVVADIIFDLQSTGDLVIQDAGTPFVTFSDSGSVGIGDTTPSATLVVGNGDLFQVAGATGNITTAGDLAVNGDDITADGATLTINAGGTVEIQDNLTITTGTTISAASVTSFNCTDCIDFDDLEDTLDLDTSLTLNQGTNTWTQNYTGTNSNGFTYNADSLTSGTALSVTSTSGNLSSGKLVELNHSATFTSSTANSGNLLNLNRSLNANGAGVALTETGTVLNITSNMNPTGGATATDSSNLLSLLQDYSSATGDVVTIRNDGSGNSISIDQLSNAAAIDINADNSSANSFNLTVDDLENGSGISISRANNASTYTNTGGGFLNITQSDSDSRGHLAHIQNESYGTSLYIINQNTTTANLGFELEYDDDALTPGSGGAIHIFAANGSLNLNSDSSSRRAAILQIETNSDTADTFNYIAFNELSFPVKVCRKLARGVYLFIEIIKNPDFKTFSN